MNNNRSLIAVSTAAGESSRIAADESYIYMYMHASISRSVSDHFTCITGVIYSRERALELLRLVIGTGFPLDDSDHSDAFIYEFPSKSVLLLLLLLLTVPATSLSLCRRFIDRDVIRTV